MSTNSSISKRDSIFSTRNVGRLWISLVLALIAISWTTVHGVVGADVSHAMTPRPPVPVVAEVPPPTFAGFVYERVHTAVARIDTKGGQGSGAYIGNRRVLTAAHVVVDANNMPYQTTGIGVRLNDGAMVFSGTLLAWSRSADVAIVELATDPGVPALKMAPAGSLIAGRKAYLVGLPVGFEGTPLMTEGVISRLDESEAREQGFEHTLVGPPGTSGAPIFDSDGRVIGIQQGEFADGAARLGIYRGVVAAAAVARLDSLVSTAQATTAVAMISKNSAVAPTLIPTKGTKTERRPLWPVW